MKKIYLSLFLALGTLASLAQSPALDPTFDPGTGFTGNNLNYKNVYATALQPDGKIIVGGNFTKFNGTPRKNIARLNADGSLDITFDPGGGFDNFVYSLAIQPDGKIIVGGDFTDYNGTTRYSIARLNVDGTLDVTFDPVYAFNGTVRSIVVQTDGKIIAGGNSTTYGKFISRLNANGSIDASFISPSNGFDGDGYSSVYTLALQADGKILVGGRFTGFNGTSRNMIARLNNDGSLDVNFNPGTGFSAGSNFSPLYSYVRTIVVQPDGKILAGGVFADFNGIGSSCIARLNADGSLDASFGIGTGFSAHVNTLVLQNDGKILAGGDFTSFNDIERRYIARLNANGSLDAGFDPTLGFNTSVLSLLLQPDEKIIAGGDFVVFHSTSRRGITRLLNGGTVTGINDIDNQPPSFTIYPNPASQLINVEFSTTFNSEEETTIEIINNVGQTVLSDKAQTKNINIQHLQSGIYFVKVGNVSKKFIKE